MFAQSASARSPNDATSDATAGNSQRDVGARETVDEVRLLGPSRAVRGGRDGEFLARGGHRGGVRVDHLRDHLRAALARVHRRRNHRRGGRRRARSAPQSDHPQTPKVPQPDERDGLGDKRRGGERVGGRVDIFRNAAARREISASNARDGRRPALLHRRRQRRVPPRDV